VLRPAPLSGLRSLPPSIASPPASPPCAQPCYAQSCCRRATQVWELIFCSQSPQSQDRSSHHHHGPAASHLHSHNRNTTTTPTRSSAAFIFAQPRLQSDLISLSPN
jgi:hypothetical protein